MTTPPDELLPLAAEFPSATREQWLRVVDGVLGGASFDTLVSRTWGGLRIEPLYERAPDSCSVSGRLPGAPWQIMQRVDHPEAGAANAEALHDLENGANGLALVFAGSRGAFGYGLDAAGLKGALANVQLDADVALELDLGWDAADAVAALTRLVEARRYDPSSLNIRFCHDPIMQGAAQGGFPDPWPAPISAQIMQIHECAAKGYPGPFLAADGRLIHAAGASEAQELGVVLAAAVTYLRALRAAEIPLERARDMLFFRLAADADQFLTMAKFRAMRKLWVRIETACGLTPKPAFVSAETAWRMMTRRDPYGNLLRAAIAAFAAGLGGADAVSVLPFTAALGLPDRFARRLARNTQLILLEEAHLARVSDPAAGSGFVEDLTLQLCRAAWTIFQEIEAAGGPVAALQQGVIQAKVAAVRAERQRAMAERRDLITGTSAFPDLAEQPVAVLDSAPHAAASRQLIGTFESLMPMRLAEPFEALRDRADAHGTATGAPPRIFLARLGQPAEVAAQVAFAKNFFAVGGIEAVTGETPVPSTEAGVNVAALTGAFAASRAKLACLCASDETLARHGAAAAAALSAAVRVYATGVGARKAAVQTMDITVIHAHSDALAILEEAQRLLGLS